MDRWKAHLFDIIKISAGGGTPPLQDTRSIFDLFAYAFTSIS